MERRHRGGAKTAPTPLVPKRRIADCDEYKENTAGGAGREFNVEAGGGRGWDMGGREMGAGSESAPGGKVGSGGTENDTQARGMRPCAKLFASRDPKKTVSWFSR